jgi:F-type H+-transporting ATPase subunit b
MFAALIFAAEEAAAATEKSLEVLPDADELLFGSIFFFILLLGLAKLVFPKLREVLANRTAKIQGQLEEAERTKRDADQLLEQYRAQLADARNEVARIVEEGKRTAEALRADLVRKAEQEAQDIVARARTEASGERDRAMAELRSTVGDLSLTLASRVIESELSNPEAQRSMVDRAIAELAGSNGRS